MSKQNAKQSWSYRIGYGLAHAQNIVDSLVDYGFRTLRNAGEKPIPKKENEKKVMRGAKQGAHSILRFLGTTGESYFDTYEELKAKKKK